MKADLFGAKTNFLVGFSGQVRKINFVGTTIIFYQFLVSLHMEAWSISTGNPYNAQTLKVGTFIGPCEVDVLTIFAALYNILKVKHPNSPYNIFNSGAFGVM